MSESWTAHHFSLANARDDGADGLPRLLRRVADVIEGRSIEAMDILDLTISSEITSDGPWWSATLYWSPEQTGRGIPISGFPRRFDARPLGGRSNTS